MSATCKPLDLSPARWLWMPCGRTLPNTALRFRKELSVPAGLRSAKGLVFADSRYCLRVNGKRVQWGPAPADPRRPEIDPVDLSSFLKEGSNLIEAEVLWLGRGEGTYIVSNPGFIFRLEIESSSGLSLVVSDSSWEVAIDRTLAPGGHEQWFLRALQEKRDLRRDGLDWMPSRELPLAACLPTICGPEHPGGPHCAPSPDTHLRPRLIPLMREELHEFSFAKGGFVNWRRDPDDWFDFRLYDSFSLRTSSFQHGAGGIEVPALADSQGCYLSFSLPEEMSGWPQVEVEAPEGTVVEMMFQESHDAVSGPAFFETAFHDWARFVCREGTNVLKPFDYYCLRWLQLHIRGNGRPVTVKAPSFLRRVYPFANEPEIKCSEPALQRLFEANVNTLKNSVTEGCIDGGGRERQQYSGDVAHQLRASSLLCGEWRHEARYLRTYADGLTVDGFFLDCWPASDRLVRLAQRQLNATVWGPIIDHGVQYVLDCQRHYMETGRREDVAPLLGALAAFGRYLGSRRISNGLIPAEAELQRISSVWMDHSPSYGWLDQKHKTCPFNLYVAGMLGHALIPLCELGGRTKDASFFRSMRESLLEALHARFWEERLGVFVDNLPWSKEEGRLWLSDRSLATDILYGLSGSKLNLGSAAGALSQGGNLGDCLDSLKSHASIIPPGVFQAAKLPVFMGLSYPPNAVWRHWALIKCGRMAKAAGLLREWAQQPSVLLNNTLSETWNPRPDSDQEWCHCPVAPLLDLAQGVAGLEPLSPGFGEILLRPQPEGFEDLSFAVHVPQGRIEVEVQRKGAKRLVRYSLPPACRWRLSVPASSSLPLPEDGVSRIPGNREFSGSGREISIEL